MTYRQDLRRMAVSSDAAFAEYVSDLIFPAHLVETERFINRHGNGGVLIPRGHAKTTQFIHRAARLVGATRGRVRFGIGCAIQGDADDRSSAVRAIVESPRFAEIFEWAQDGVRGRDWTDEHWTIRGNEALLGKDFTMRAIGLQSVRPGARFDVFLGDDLVGPQENTTEGMRRKASTTYWSVIDPMVVPDSPALRQAMDENPLIRFPVAPDGSVPGVRWFLGTRWHEADLWAELIEKGWPFLVKQAIQADGSVLWPGYWTDEKLAAKRADLGTPIFNLQYQNDPSGMGGNIFKRDWFRYVDRVPDGARRVGVDLAASKDERNDYTTAVEWVEDADHNLYMVGAYRARIDEGHRHWLTGVDDEGTPIDTEPAASGPRLLWPSNRLGAGFAGVTTVSPAPRPLTVVNIEAVIFQSTFAREVLAKTRLPAMAVYPDKDKVTRSRTLAARYEAGKVFHLKGAVGLSEYESELVAFPNGEHDDLVDGGVYGADLNTASEFYFTSGKR